MKKRKEIQTILAIDTSCDDTSVAVTSGVQVLSNVISSQIDLHKAWGGVVPGIARREHEKRIDFVVEEALKQAGKEMDEIDAIAVTQGPGLAIALEVGIRKAKKLALEYDKPLIPVDHMEGHLLSSFAGEEGNMDEIFPVLGVLVSGGHTQLVLASGVGEYEIIGETLDDAIGEAFDKVAKILGIGYPGGPIVSKMAKEGDSEKHDLPVAMKNSADFNVSYSGLKTAVLYLVRDLKGESRMGQGKKGVSWKPGVEAPDHKDERSAVEVLGKQTVADICASFQKAAVETLMNKTRKALKKYPEVKSIFLGGGVVHNEKLQKEMKKLGQSRGVKVQIPKSGDLFMDNAAMIGVAGFLSMSSGNSDMLQGKKKIDQLDRDPGMRL